MKLVFDKLDILHDTVKVSFDGETYKSFNKADVLARCSICCTRLSAVVSKK